MSSVLEPAQANRTSRRTKWDYCTVSLLIVFMKQTPRTISESPCQGPYSAHVSFTPQSVTACLRVSPRLVGLFRFLSGWSLYFGPVYLFWSCLFISPEAVQKRVKEVIGSTSAANLFSVLSLLFTGIYILYCFYYSHSTETSTLLCYMVYVPPFSTSPQMLARISWSTVSKAPIRVAMRECRLGEIATHIDVLLSCW